MPTMLKIMSEDMLGHVEDYVRRHSWTCWSMPSLKFNQFVQSLSRELKIYDILNC